MEHLAIMKKGYIEKILSGEKKIESRFSMNRATPYHKISIGDQVYMQEVGKEVTAVFEVADVLFFDHLSEEKVDKIRAQYGKDICADEDFWERKKNAQYATLIYIKEPRLVTPFKIYKHDRSAFKTVESVKRDLVIEQRTIVKHPHDCENGKHYFVFDGHTYCRFCGCDFPYTQIMQARPDYQMVKDVMRISMWNEEWLHAELDSVAKNKLYKIKKEDIKRRLKKSIGVCRADDGRQTPYYGDPIFYAQHGLGCCCRKCIEKFYGISREAALSAEDLEYFVTLIMTFIQEHSRENGD